MRSPSTLSIGSLLSHFTSVLILLNGPSKSFFFGLWRNHPVCKTSCRSLYRLLVSFVQSYLIISFLSNVAYSSVHTFAQNYGHAAAIIDLNLIPAHLDSHAWCQIEFSHKRHSPLLSPRGFQERMDHDLWSVESVESEKIEIVIGTWNCHVRRDKMSKKRRKKKEIWGERELIRLSWYKRPKNDL